MRLHWGGGASNRCHDAAPGLRLCEMDLRARLATERGMFASRAAAMQHGGKGISHWKTRDFNDRWDAGDLLSAASPAN